MNAGFAIFALYRRQCVEAGAFPAPESHTEGIDMSRAYRISVKETVRKVVRAEDHVSSHLEMLDILPAGQMADLLAAELARQGFERDGETAQRRDGETTVTVDLKTGMVTVRSESKKKVEITEARTGTSWGSEKDARGKIKNELVRDLEKQVSDEQRELQQQITDTLEGQLADLRQELDQAANRATAEALKQKAAQIGQIKELTEDPESGSLTIIVEV
jgi:hypothetical protein